MLNYEEIMREITSKLTGEPSKDVRFLKKQVEKYKNHKLSTELLRGVGRLLFEVIPEDKKQEFDQLLNNDFLGIDAVVEEAQYQIYKKNYDRALALIEGIVKRIEGPRRLYDSDNVSEYFCFENILEEILYRELYNPTKEIRCVSEDYGSIYFIYGNLLFEFNRFDEAKDALLKAIKWNPIKVDPLFELGEIYKKDKQCTLYLELIRKCLERAYVSEDIARCYRNLGYYYIERENFELAIALYVFSMEFSADKKTAQSELQYISQIIGKKISSPSFGKIQKLFKENGIQLGANDLVLQIAVSLGHQAKEEKAYEPSKYFYSIAYDLTGNEQVKAWIDSLPGDKE